MKVNTKKEVTITLSIEEANFLRIISGYNNTIATAINLDTRLPEDEVNNFLSDLYSKLRLI